MSGFLGADPDELESLALALQNAARLLDARRMMLNGALHSVVWHGERADEFRWNWDRTYVQILARASQGMADAAKVLRFEVTQQLDASDGQYVSTNAPVMQVSGSDSLPSLFDGNLVRILSASPLGFAGLRVGD